MTHKSTKNTNNTVATSTMSKKSSTAQNKIEIWLGISLLITVFLFIILSSTDWIPRKMQSPKLRADHYCQQQGYDQSYKQGYDINKNYLIYCNTIHYNQTPQGIKVWSDTATYYNPYEEQ